MRVLAIVVLILFVTAIATFCFQNQGSVEVRFLNWSWNLPMPGLILGVYVLGMVSGWSVLTFIRRTWSRAFQQQ